MSAILIALFASCAAFLLILAFAPSPPSRGKQREPLFRAMVTRRAAELQAARLQVDPEKFTLACIVSPFLLLLVGIVFGSVVVGLFGAAAGLLAPRIYLDGLVRAQQRRTEAEAPRLLQIIVSSLAGGRTYLEALEEAHRRVKDKWLRDDLEHIITQFHLDVPLEKSISDVRCAASGRNLRLIWDNLAICLANRIPASRAKGLFQELSSTVQFNVQVQQEVRAKTSGQRIQIWLLAAIVPGLYLYLRLINPDFFFVLDQTFLGKFVLFPAAVALEVLGLVLSFRVASVEA
jgi:Flp pilus assembly protein TadB